MIGGIIEGACAIIIALVGGSILIGQMKENAKRNKDDIDAIKETMVQGQVEMRELIASYQEDMKATIEKYQEDMKDMLDEEKDNSRESLSREVSHIRETLAMNINEIRDDIRRLEQNQNENARLREDIVLLKSAVKSLHNRLDIDPPILLKNDD